MKLVYPLEDRCIDCHLCEVACVVEHSRTKTPTGAHFVENLHFNREHSRDEPDPAVALAQGRPKSLARCFVEANPPISLSTNCRHCDEPDCVLACKNGSLYKAEDGRTLLLEDKCVGCWMCVMACRYGAISRNPYQQNVPRVPSNGINLHCDLCPDRDLPACVSVCPTNALVYEDRSEQPPNTPKEEFPSS